MTTKSKPPGGTVWAETMGSVLIPHSVMLPSTAPGTNHETSPRSALCAECASSVRSSTNFSHLPGGYFSDSIKLLTNHRYNTRTTAMAAASTTAPPAFPKSPVPRPAPRAPLRRYPYPILRRMSSTRQNHAAPAAPCSAWLRGTLARQPRRAGGAARAVGKAWPLAGGAGERAAGASVARPYSTAGRQVTNN